MADIINGRYALADPYSGLTVFSLEGGELNMFGSCTKIRTSQIEVYPAIDDAPTELEMVSKSNFLSTLAYGLIGAAVSACFAAVAISIVASATILTGGAALAACAFLGASLATLVATTGMVESDLRTGNNRNPVEFTAGLMGAALIGFGAGATVYGIIAAAPALAAGASTEIAMYLGKSNFTEKVVPNIVKASGGAIAAAETVFSVNDAYACGSGYNPLLDVAFDNDIEAYETAEFCIDTLALGYVQAAEAYGRSCSGEGVYIENEDDQSDDIRDVQIQDEERAVFKYKHDPSQNPKVLRDAVEDPNAVYGFRPRKGGSLDSFVYGDWEDPAAVEIYRQNRIAYHNRNEGAAQQIVSDMTAKGASVEEIAKAACEYRNQSRISAYLDFEGNIINIDGYNAALLRAESNSYDNLIQRGKTPEQIIKTATKGNPAMDACTGLYDEYFDTY